jgi:hypothetical protein
MFELYRALIAQSGALWTLSAKKQPLGVLRHGSVPSLRSNTY